jgi:hypothetical protein
MRRGFISGLCRFASLGLRLLGGSDGVESEAGDALRVMAALRSRGDARIDGRPFPL